MCYAKRIGDQMICGPCGMNWDHNDPEPPACRKIDKRMKVLRQMDAIFAPAKPRALPANLPAAWAVEMDRAYKNGGMLAAYRVLLDRIDQ